jgi:tRNA(Leu) C34 or U34 (ribose-2'-O)-methylase TrmL
MTAPLTIAETLDPRNVTDQFKGMTDDFIRGEQEKRRIPLVTIALNMTHDFNKATVLRTHSGVAGQAFYFLNKPNDQKPGHPEGTKKFDKRGTVGTHNYNTVNHYSIERYMELFAELRADGYTIVAVDNVDGYDAKMVYDVELPEKVCFIMGEEKTGIPSEVIDAADMMVFLPMMGVSPRSYNVSVAHAGVVFEYVRQNRHLVK